MNNESKTNLQRRRLLLPLGAIGVVSALPGQWSKPFVNAVVLPAHAQTSMCMPDTQVGGPLAGHPSGASSCQAACEAEAADLNAQLCEVTETTDAATGAVQCSCDIDLP